MRILDYIYVVQVKELGEIETRVKQALVKKDIIIATLREQLFAAHKQIQSTESLLQEEHNALISEQSHYRRTNENGPPA